MKNETFQAFRADMFEEDDFAVWLDDAAQFREGIFGFRHRTKNQSPKSGIKRVCGKRQGLCVRLNKTDFVCFRAREFEHLERDFRGDGKFCWRVKLKIRARSRA